MAFNKDIFDACLQLGEFSAARHDKRREYEWKVTFGFWAAPLAALVAKFDLPLTSETAWGGAIVLTALFITYVWWQIVMMKGNENHKMRQWHWKDEAEKYLLREETAGLTALPLPLRPTSSKFSPHLVQLAVAAILFLLLWIAKFSAWRANIVVPTS